MYGKIPCLRAIIFFLATGINFVFKKFLPESFTQFPTDEGMNKVRYEAKVPN